MSNDDQPLPFGARLLVSSPARSGSDSMVPVTVTRDLVFLQQEA